MAFDKGLHKKSKDFVCYSIHASLFLYDIAFVFY